MTIIQKILTIDNILFMLKCAGLSLFIASCSIVFGTILGIIGASGKISKHKLPRVIANIYVELIRGTPMLLQILFIFLAVPSIVNTVTGNNFFPDPIIVGIIAMSINSGAYSTELIRSGIESIDRGQWEAGMSLGLSRFKIMKKIILPQAFKRIVPPLVSEFITLIKDSSLISTIGAVELLKSSQIIGVRYYNYVVPLLSASIIYLVMTLTISFIAKYLERRLKTND